MGRSSENHKETMEVDAQSSSSGAHEEAFPRRSPRVGNQFQTKIAKSKEFLERPQPQLMSSEFPYIRESEVLGRDHPSQVPSTHPNELKVIDANIGSCRGGQLVHRPSANAERFQHFVQPIFGSNSSSLVSGPIDCTWHHRLMHLHSTGVPKKRSRVPRGAKKRKHSENSEKDIVLGLNDITQEDLYERKQRPRLMIGAGEDEALVAEKLFLRFGGNVSAAELNVLVDLTSGNGRKSVRSRKRQLEKEKKTTNAPSSDAWRSVYHNMFLKPYGQQFLLSEKDASAETTGTHSYDSPKYDNSTVFASGISGDDLKGVWRSILAVGKALEHQLQYEASTLEKPLLSTVVAFLTNAFHLPKPESSFGTHHVIVEELTACLLFILDHAEIARDVQAKLRDIVYLGGSTGVDTASLSKFLENEATKLTIVLDEASKYQDFVVEVTKWESRCSSLLDTDDRSRGTPGSRNDLKFAEELVLEARSHGFICKTLVDLKSRIQRAHELRRRISQWFDDFRSGNKGTTKAITALVREANRIRFTFPEVETLSAFHNKVESWIDRANIAIRSRISLDEIRALLANGEDIPLDLSEYSEKLQVRVRAADDWLLSLNEVIPCAIPEKDGQYLPWIAGVRRVLSDGMYSEVHDLAVEGSRIPVEVKLVKVLQVELDAKSWTARAKRWIPGRQDSKRGKIEDMRDHLEKGSDLRERLVMCENEKKLWTLEGEMELSSIVEMADLWFENYQMYLEGDNRRSLKRECLSIRKLREIVKEGESIYANLGNATTKISRILFQAEEWFDQNKALLVRCGLENKGCDESCDSPSKPVTVEEMSDALDMAVSSIAIDLDEVKELHLLLSTTKDWFEQVATVIPKKGKRNGKLPRPKYRVEDLRRLIKEASSIPVATSDEVTGLQIQLGNVEAWASEARMNMKVVTDRFESVCKATNVVFGWSEHFATNHLAKYRQSDDVTFEEKKVDPSVPQMNAGEDPETKCEDEDSKSNIRENVGTPFIDCHELDQNLQELCTMVQELLQGAAENGVVTSEAEVLDLFDKASRWCSRSMKYVSTPSEIFDKRYHGAFDRFIKEGEEIVKASGNLEALATAMIDPNWSRVVSDQLERLQMLRLERDRFSKWCNGATQALLDVKKLSLEKLRNMTAQSKSFPIANDLVNKIRQLFTDCESWVEEVRSALDSNKRISQSQAKTFMEQGEKLKVGVSELKVLRTSLRNAKNWSNRVQKCVGVKDSEQVGNVQDLLTEYESMIISMPDEESLLLQATESYCVCRRPYEGFMIGCDNCEEWYHGPCVGVSESRADRVDRYVCVRCSMKNTFVTASNIAAGIIKKWTNKKDLKKFRQIDYQKHQRKVRKEKKDIQKFQGELETLRNLAKGVEKVHDPAPLDSNHEAEVCAPMPQAQEATPKDSIMKESSTAQEASPTDSIMKESSTAQEATPTDSLVKESTTAQEATPTDSLVKESPTAQEMTAEQAPEQPCLPEEKERIEEIEVKIRKIVKECGLAEGRLQALVKRGDEQKEVERLEDSNSSNLKRWCIRVRSLVLIPTHQLQAEKARPLLNGDMSEPMIQVLADADRLGVSDLPDRATMENCFKSMSWSLCALSILSRKPRLQELKSLLVAACNIQLPDEKGIRIIRHMVQKASQMQTKVQKVLAPKPGALKAVDLKAVKEMLNGIQEFTAHLPEIGVLRSVIKDKGVRHCHCRWPNDGRFMLSCDKCQSSFHGECVGVTRKEDGAEGGWMCDGCAGRDEMMETCEFVAPVDYENLPYVSHSDQDISPHAIDPKRLWPPFALLGSPESTKILNAESFCIPDDLDDLDGPKPKDELLTTAEDSGSKAASAVEKTDGNAETVHIVLEKANSESTDQCGAPEGQHPEILSSTAVVEKESSTVGEQTESQKISIGDTIDNPSHKEQGNPALASASENAIASTAKDSPGISPDSAGNPHDVAMTSDTPCTASKEVLSTPALETTSDSMEQDEAVQGSTTAKTSADTGKVSPGIPQAPVGGVEGAEVELDTTCAERKEVGVPSSPAQTSQSCMADIVKVEYQPAPVSESIDGSDSITQDSIIAEDTEG